MQLDQINVKTYNELTPQQKKLLKEQRLKMLENDPYYIGNVKKPKEVEQQIDVYLDMFQQTAPQEQLEMPEFRGKKYDIDRS